MRSFLKQISIAVTLACLVPVLPAAGSSITYSFASGNLSASAKFERSGSNLIVTLTNTSSADADVPTDILTGILFEVQNDPALVPVSAIVPAGGLVLVGGTGVDVTPSDGVVGGEWAYLNGLNQMPPLNSAISSSGLGIFGPHNLFPGPNLQGPESPSGLEFGITSAGDDLATGNGGISGRDLIKNSVVFTLSGFSGEPSERIQAVTFQYGTATDEPRFDGQVPEPSGLALAAMGLAGVICALGRIGSLLCRERSGVR